MTTDPISWSRLRAIFGNPKPVISVIEQQFDYNDEKLQELGRTPFDQINFDDLWYYHHDLAYVDLQPELFAYLFPVCLMDWHQSLLANQACSHGDSEFHYGIIQGNVLSKMLTEDQLQAVCEVFHDSLLYRLDQERGFKYDGMRTPAYGWIGRLNSLGLFASTLPRVWEDWWKIDTPGRAVCLLQYCSSLMYFESENPLFPAWTRDKGGGAPCLWGTDSLVNDRGWTEENTRFVTDFLTRDRIHAAVLEAAARLERLPEQSLAERLANDCPQCMELVDLRLAELPQLLTTNSAMEWSV